MVILINEIWKDVIGFEGLYKVSNLGRVKTLPRLRICDYRRTMIKEKILTGTKIKAGYIRYVLGQKGNARKVAAHQLVMEAFVGPRIDNAYINHINHNPSDNRLSNLEYVSFRENISHGHKFRDQSSKYTGVNRVKGKEKWAANCVFNGKKKHLGYFYSEIEAHKAYLNFINNNNIKNKYL